MKQKDMEKAGKKTRKTFMDCIKLSSDEIADEIDAIANGFKYCFTHDNLKNGWSYVASWRKNC